LLLFLGALIGFGSVVIRRKQFPDNVPEPLYRSILAASLAYLLANCGGTYAVKGIHLEWAVLLSIQVAMIREYLPAYV